MDDEARRSWYQDIQEGRPELFVNPEGAPVEILLDPADIAAAEEAATAQLADYHLPAEWGATGVVYVDPFLMILRDAVRTPAGLGTYIRAINAGNAAGVVILPRYRDDIVLIRHFRHSTRDWHLEIPRGFGTIGSGAADDARRELEEEIGVPATRLEPLGVVYPDTGASGTPVELFYAEVEAEPWLGNDKVETIDAIRLVSPAELATLIADGTITDGFTIAAFARATLRGLLPIPGRPIPGRPEGS
jgi:ADP-ribose pyrophosphatase